MILNCYDPRADLSDALRRLKAHNIPLDGASDHGVSEALYLRDPDQNGVELYWDRPKDEWPRKADGSLAMVTARLGGHAEYADRVLIGPIELIVRDVDDKGRITGLGLSFEPTAPAARDPSRICGRSVARRRRVV